MVQLACERPEKLEAKSVLGALRPRFSLLLAVIEDDDADFQTITLLMKQASLLDAKTIRFRNVDEFLKTSDGTFHVILLDRFIQRAGISEDRIREIKRFILTLGLSCTPARTAHHCDQMPYKRERWPSSKKEVCLRVSLNFC